eukprot:TRINITY_DN42365_c0_g1_i1.p1 TRINITY_DN42365_c0_g1~~TRINITY_DN42365_c0_g1_i1.p1  ORF type:complete len:775 (+),score=127.01 TRINITY_DN42365_c0_g1_i1:81-2405(+)
MTSRGYGSQSVAETTPAKTALTGIPLIRKGFFAGGAGQQQESCQISLDADSCCINGSGEVGNVLEEDAESSGSRRPSGEGQAVDAASVSRATSRVRGRIRAPRPGQRPSSREPAESRAGEKTTVRRVSDGNAAAVSPAKPAEATAPTRRRRIACGWRAQFVVERSKEVETEWQEETCLGAGEFARVFRKRCPITLFDRAVKIVSRQEAFKFNCLIHEAAVLQALDHPHIVRIFSWSQAGLMGRVDLECAEGGTMGEITTAVRHARRAANASGCACDCHKCRGCSFCVSNEWSVVAFRQVFEAVAYCHSKGVLHKDLKVENILLRQPMESGERFWTELPHAVVCDFGLAECLEPAPGSGFKRGVKAEGSPATMAPEVFRKNCSEKSDVWSLGCVLFKFISGRLPFVPKPWGDPPYGKVLEPLQRAGPKWSEMMSYGDFPEATDLIQRLLLQFEEEKRPTCRECLAHPWFATLTRWEATPMTLEVGELRSACEALLAWPNRSPLSKSIFMKIAAEHPGVHHMAKFFTAFDLNRDGMLTQAEVELGLQKASVVLGGACPPGLAGMATRQWVASSLDYNKDGKIEYLEFAAACLPCLGIRFHAMLRAEFHALISLSPASQGWSSSGLRDTTAEDTEERLQLQSILRLFRPPADLSRPLDCTGTGRISFAEFCDLVGIPYSIVSQRLETAKRETSPMTSQTSTCTGSSGNGGTPDETPRPLPPGGPRFPNMPSAKPNPQLPVQEDPGEALSGVQKSFQTVGFQPTHGFDVPAAKPTRSG